MKLVRFGAAGSEKPGLLDSSGKIRDLSGVIKDITPNELTPAGLKKLAGVKASDLPAVAGNPRLGVPYTGIGKIVAIGLNYRDHAAEVGATLPDEPVVFMKATSSISGPNDAVILPKGSEKTDWEVELAIVIGTKAQYVDKAKALDHVAGYTICNDVTTRSLVYRRDLKAIGTDWFAAKNAPTFLPTGPFLVPAANAGDPASLHITLRHNGITRQDEDCADMLFDLPAILAYITSVTELGPGDLVLTGSPAGNGAHWGVYLAEGDLIEGEITGLGTQRNRCISKHSVSKHSVQDAQ
jgi:2-keto-4-pentenoate hydratase/2-oxohepta-3-ene-1,7-dioic acid hydratase in catechol pathway